MGRIENANLVLKQAYEGIINIARVKKCSQLELDRLLCDLEIARTRLASREYRQSNFRPRNILSIPDRTDEIFKDLTFYWSIGQIWKEIIKNSFHEETQWVAEIGCGYIPKVGLGLSYFGFKGSLDLIDVDSRAAKKASSFLGLFGANFKSYSRVSSIFAESEVRYDSLLANHLLDDIILSNFCELNSIAGFKMYEREDEYKKTWQKIVSNSEFIPALMEELAETLLAKVKPGGIILLLDYPSFTHKALKLFPLIKQVKQAQSILRNKLENLGAIQIKGVMDEALKFDRLMVNPTDLICFRKMDGGKSNDF